MSETAETTRNERFIVQPDGARNCAKCGLQAEFVTCKTCGGDGIKELEYDRRGNIIGAKDCLDCEGTGGDWICEVCDSV